ncbi:MAG TPA: hypothetical protein VK489_02285, partial [Ferruginibacter sp.]|nr:hypothetical protein [Ferruginibacter sp.]
MKKLIVTGILCTLYICGVAQQPYPPAPPAAGNITAMEYFFDSNPGFGNGTALTGFTALPNIVNYNGTVSLAGVAPGFHRFYIRTKNVNGTWSLTNNVFFDNYNVPVYNSGPPAPPNIT